MTIAVIGTGTWGTAAAVLAARTSSPILLWGRRREQVERLAASRCHPRLPQATLPATIELSASPGDLARASMLLWAVPTQHCRAVARDLAPHLDPEATLVSLAKGLEQGSLARVSEILAEELPGRAIACLSGPSHAEEVVAGLPCALVAAGDRAVAAQLVQVFHNGRLRIYTTDDLVGVELCGALKNVIAVAAGMCQGLGLGDNATAALITRGLAELRRLGRALGAQEATFAGLAGIGDLMTTCYSAHGRNRALGLALARGDDLTPWLDGSGQVAEGAWTCRAAVALGQRVGLELPIASQVASVLWSGTPMRDAIGQLLARASREENA